MRTKDQISRQISGLKKMKEWLPETSLFGEPNWEKIDAQVSILEGEVDFYDFDEGDWDEMDDINKIYIAAEEAQQWLDEETDDDLFEEQ